MLRLTRVSDTPSVVRASRAGSLRALGRLPSLHGLPRPGIAWTGFVLLGLVASAALMAPLLTPYDPTSAALIEQFKAPSLAHPFGTDEVGRDVLTRVLYGFRYSLIASAAVVLLAVPVGSLLGAIAGFYGSRVDAAVMRLTDVFMAFPSIILAIAIATSLGPGLRNTTIAIAIVWWPWYARLMRGQVLTIKQRDYIEAAYSLGATRMRILTRHILPNSWAPVLVMATTDLGIIMLVTSGLSFVGLGARPPTPDLGAMIAAGRVHAIDYWWIIAFPGLAIAIAALGSSLAGDTLRDRLDPTSGD